MSPESSYHNAVDPLNVFSMKVGGKSCGWIVNGSLWFIGLSY